MTSRRRNHAHGRVSGALAVLTVVTGLVLVAACGGRTTTATTPEAGSRTLEAVTGGVSASRIGPCTLPANNVPPAGGCPGPRVAGCPILPSDNPWNTRVDNLPLRANSSSYISNLQSHSNGNTFLHMDFYSDTHYGFPVMIVPQSQPLVNINYTAYGSESDKGPFPIPLNAPIETASSDHHVIVLQQGTCVLYELYGAQVSGSGWNAQSGARWPLNTNALRPDGWTSADAAGLPMFPGLVRYDEVAAGAIEHALRFTVVDTQNAFIHPATHRYAGSDPGNPYAAPWGLRLRLKASFDRTPFHGEARVILDAMAKYGMIVADNGSNWFVSGQSDSRWNDAELNTLKSVSGDNFEVVDNGPIQH